MNRAKYNALVQKKLMLESKIKLVKEHQRRNSLSFLIEDTIEKAEIVLAAKAIVDHFGKMAEDTAKIEGDDLMPMMDSLKAAFGAQMAQQFQSTISDQARAAVQSLTQTKDAVSAAVGKLEAVANGNPMPNDMASDPLNDPAAGADPAAADPAMADPAAAPMGGEPDLGALGDDAADPLADEGGEGPLGRTRKESVQRRGKPLTEGLLDSIKGVLTAHFDDVTADRSPREQLEALKPFITAADYEVAAQFPDSLLASIFDRSDAAVGMGADAPVEVTMEPDTGLAGGVEIEDGAGLDDVPALPAPSAPKPSELGALTPGPSVSDIGASAGLPVGDDPLDDLDDDMESDFASPMETDPLDAPFESINSPARRLRESKNPDAVIYNVFSRVVKEGHARRASAQKVAEKFGLDYSDVVSVIKEAEAVRKVAAAATKPGRDWKRLYREAKEDGLTRSAIITLIAEASIDRRSEGQIRQWIVESEKQDAIFGKKGDKKDGKSKGKPWDKKDDCEGDECDKEKVDESVRSETSTKRFSGSIAAQDYLKKEGFRRLGPDSWLKQGERADIKAKIDDISTEGATKIEVTFTTSHFEKVDEKAAPRTRIPLDQLEREMGQKKIKLDKHLDKKKDAPKKVDEADSSKEKYKLQVRGEDNKWRDVFPVKAFDSADEAVSHGRDHGKSHIGRYRGVPMDASKISETPKKVDEAEGDTGFNSVTKATYPEASAPAFRSNSGKGGKGTDKTEKPMVVGSKINPAKGNPATAGKMADKGSKKVEEGQDDVTGLPTAPNGDRGFPEATNPAFKKNTKQSGKSDPAGKSPVVGGNKDPKKGNPASAGKMAESVKKK